MINDNLQQSQIQGENLLKDSYLTKIDLTSYNDCTKLKLKIQFWHGENSWWKSGWYIDGAYLIKSL